MLSFDITDRNVRIIKGVETNGKIKISSAATLNLEEEVIVNGHVKDIPRVATLINGVLKKSKMADKEAIVSISSNLTIFKELHIPKAKEQEFAKRVKQEMQTSLGIDDSYSVSYTIVGEADEKNENGEVVQKVLATACPYEIIECYKKVFQMLGISLKSVMIGCNCITKVLLADTKIKSMMPLLAVQIDPNFISLNLYENGQLSFSRFASIDAADYGNSEDYVFEAVSENIFRMLQFHKSRSHGDIIENVILYGDTHEYVRITDELNKMDLKTSLIGVPPQIHGYENLEFSLYANAIGAMFKRNKEVERINLLTTDTVNNNKIKSDSSYGVMLVGVTVACLLIVGGIWGVLTAKNSGIIKDINALQEKIDSPETKAALARNTKLTDMKVKVDNYYVMINNAHDAYISQPVILGSKYDKIEEVIKSSATDLKVERTLLDNVQYSGGTLTMDIELDGVEEPSQKLPAKIVENLLKVEDFVIVTYNDYSVSENLQEVGTVITDPENPDATITVVSTDPNAAKHTVQFSISIQISGGSIYTPEETDDSTTEKEAE